MRSYALYTLTHRSFRSEHAQEIGASGGQIDQIMNYQDMRNSYLFDIDVQSKKFKFTIRLLLTLQSMFTLHAERAFQICNNNHIIRAQPNPLPYHSPYITSHLTSPQLRSLSHLSVNDPPQDLISALKTQSGWRRII